MKDVSIAPELKRLELCTQIHKVTSLGGGSISQAACYSTDKGDYFVKVSPMNGLRLFTDLSQDKFR